ncbi:MAG: MAPEG family protein [Cycloclasticus sp.]|nr:MAPEG family protein [Cycloclasticus sp.]
MLTIIICLTCIAFMPYVASTIGGYYRLSQTGVYDLVNPRVQAAKLEGAGARSQYLQANCWEALIFFSVAILGVFVTQAIGETTVMLSVSFVLIRCVYFVAYLTNMARLRFSSFGLSFACCVWLFYIAITTAAV